MKCSSLFLSSGLLAASVWIPGSESFRSISFSSRHNTNSGIPEKTIHNNRNNNDDCISLHNSMKSNNNNDDMITAQEAEAQKICPLVPPPENVHATFEAAMG
jgi:hypothetical protein